MLNYFATLFVVFLGLPVGYLISYLAKEELKPGKKYFILFKSVLFSLILMSFFSYINLSFYIIIPLTFFIFVGIFFWLKKYNTIYNEIFFSCILAIIYAESFSPIISVLLFSFFIVSSALDYKKGILSILLTRILFLIIGFILNTI